MKHKWHKEIKAWADGLTIQYKDENFPNWIDILYPDWVGGMFMLFSREMFSAIRGFDERYFLYYEDVDLCARLTLRGYKVCLTPKSKVIHQAQRTSHRNLRYLRWHLSA